MQHDTNEEFKWDGDTLETKGGYHVIEERGRYNVYIPHGTWFHRGYSRYESETIIRQHMHEQNMANGYDIDWLATFVPGQPWNRFPWAGEVPNGRKCWRVPGIGLMTEGELIIYARRIARGEIDDPRREHSVDANKKVEQAKCDRCGRPTDRARTPHDDEYFGPCDVCNDQIPDAGEKVEVNQLKAVQAAEDDLLGQALAHMRLMLTDLESGRRDPGTIGIARAILDKAKGGE